MGRQSSRIYFKRNDHKEIYYQGKYHKAMYIGNELVWEKGGNENSIPMEVSGKYCVFYEKSTITGSDGDLMREFTTSMHVSVDYVRGGIIVMFPIFFIKYPSWITNISRYKAKIYTFSNGRMNTEYCVDMRGVLDDGELDSMGTVPECGLYYYVGVESGRAYYNGLKMEGVENLGIYILDCNLNEAFIGLNLNPGMFDSVFGMDEEFYLNKITLDMRSGFQLLYCEFRKIIEDGYMLQKLYSVSYAKDVRNASFTNWKAWNLYPDAQKLKVKILSAKSLNGRFFFDVADAGIYEYVDISDDGAYSTRMVLDYKPYLKYGKKESIGYLCNRYIQISFRSYGLVVFDTNSDSIVSESKKTPGYYEAKLNDLYYNTETQSFVAAQLEQNLLGSGKTPKDAGVMRNIKNPEFLLYSTVRRDFRECSWADLNEHIENYYMMSSSSCGAYIGDDKYAFIEHKDDYAYSYIWSMKAAKDYPEKEM